MNVLAGVTSEEASAPVRVLENFTAEPELIDGATDKPEKQPKESDGNNVIAPDEESAPKEQSPPLF